MLGKQITKTLRNQILNRHELIVLLLAVFLILTMTTAGTAIALLPEKEPYNFTYSITYVFPDEKDKITVLYKKGDEFTIPSVPEKEGYFVSWSWNDKSVEEMKESMDNNIESNRSITVRLKYQAVEYTISYNLAGGVWTEGETNFYEAYNIETETFVLGVPTKEGLTFLGWSGTDIEGVSYEVSIIKGSVGDRSYVANYNKYRLALDLKGGKMNHGEINPIGFSELTPTFVVKNPIKKGYGFLGWIDVEEPQGLPITNLEVLQGTSKNLSYYAMWGLSLYDISIDLKGGEFLQGEGLESNTYTIEDVNTIAIPNPVKNGYEFLGWTCDNDYPTPNLQAVVNPLTMEGDKHFVAHWKIIG